MCQNIQNINFENEKDVHPVIYVRLCNIDVKKKKQFKAFRILALESTSDRYTVTILPDGSICSEAWGAGGSD